MNDFYSHAREGRDNSSAEAQGELNNFYSHAREGRDSSDRTGNKSGYRFLLTRPRGA